MSEFILAIDQGTTGSTALIISPKGEVLARANCEFKQHFPKPGWVEHDANDIWQSVGTSVTSALKTSQLDAKHCVAIGITNQRETVLAWNKTTGAPVHHAIVWQDRRTAERCDALKQAGHESMIQVKTGLLLDPYFSASKIEWLFKNVNACKTLAAQNELAVGTIDSYLVYRLSDKALHITDATNASRTMLLDIHHCAWDEQLLALFDVPKSCLPQVRGCAEVYGHTKNAGFLPDGIPIAGIAGDQQAALFGQRCIEPMQAKCTYGTGAFLLVNTGHQAITSHHRLLTTIAWQLEGTLTYALEGSVFMAGAIIQWLRDGLGIIARSSDVEALAQSVESTGGVTLVPAFAGLGAPHWDPHARAMITGLTRGSTRAHLARAALEAIALQVYDLVHAMNEDTHQTLAELKVDGGASEDNLLMQMQSDLLNVPIIRAITSDTTAYGAGLLAGLGVKLYSKNEISESARQKDSFRAIMSADIRNQVLQRWRNALHACKALAER